MPSQRQFKLFPMIAYPVQGSLSGLLIGLAWQERISGGFGILAVGLFFYFQLVAGRRRWLALFHAQVTGTAAFLVGGSWLDSTVQILGGTGPALSTGIAVAICFFHGSMYTIFSLLWSLLGKTLACWWLTCPVAWFLSEQILPGMFPCQIGCLLSEFPAVCQLCELGGINLLSLFAAFLATTVPLILHCFIHQPAQPDIHKQHRFAIAGIVGVAMVAAFWGTQRINDIQTGLRLSRLSYGGLNALVVQTETQSVASNGRMIKAARSVKGQADLVVWPEGALGNYDQDLVDFRDPKHVLENSAGNNMRFQPFPQPTAPLLAGASTWQADPASHQSRKNFVSAILIDTDEQLLGRHDKVHLMPYGESIPGESVIPWLRTWFGSKRVISAARSARPIGEVKGVQIGVFLCCEDMHPNLVRSLTTQGAELLVSLGNGMAFRSPVALKQHFRIARFRSIENRKYFLRCMSKGVSAVMDPTGKIVASMPNLQDGAMLVNIPHWNSPPTLFVRYGNSVSWILVFGLIAYCILPGLIPRAAH